VKELKPDVVILDVNMPGMNGLEALRRIMTECPTNVLMLSTLTKEGAQTTFRALELGAVDFLDKNAGGTTSDLHALGPLLREKVLAVRGAALPLSATGQPAEPLTLPTLPYPDAVPYEVVAIGASTGGPRAITQLLSRLPAAFPIPIIIAQHMPPGFTRLLSERLDRLCALSVLEAADGQFLSPGTASIAPGGSQIALVRVAGRLRLKIDSGPTKSIHRPSVDLLLRSTAQVVGPRAIGIVLTGMGSDGAKGLRALRRAGSRTLVESEETAVIYGMPRAAAAFAERAVPLTEMAPVLVSLASSVPDAGMSLASRPPNPAAVLVPKSGSGRR
jgi:two-component system chemotaxis response regulator CheB